jgi:hypothetical protein
MLITISWLNSFVTSSRRKYGFSRTRLSISSLNTGIFIPFIQRHWNYPALDYISLFQLSYQRFDDVGWHKKPSQNKIIPADQIEHEDE